MDSAKKKILLALGKRGQIAFTTPGTYEWTPPAGVRFLGVVLVGPASFSGGGLSWFNGIPTSGNPIRIEVGSGSSRTDTPTRITVDGNTYQVTGRTGGGIHSEGAPFSAKGGGNGGSAIVRASNGTCGGGAAGYSGNGADGDIAVAPPGGGGSGGSAGGGGGGVGLLGEGPSGAARSQGGSGGENGTGRGGRFGGGTGGNQSNNGYASGAVRFIWGAGRAFPSTRTGDE